MLRRWVLGLLLLLLLLGGCAKSEAPELTTFKEQHFTIGLPAGWAVQDRSESGDQVIFADPKAPDVFVVVYSYVIPAGGSSGAALSAARWAKLAMRWQFADRNPVPVKSPNGLDGIMAEGAAPDGPDGPDPRHRVRAAGALDGDWRGRGAQGAVRGIEAAAGRHPEDDPAGSRAVTERDQTTIEAVWPLRYAR